MSSWPPGTGEMVERIAAHDWGATPLGPVEAWSERLKLMVEQVLATPLVASLVCGPDRILIYNDAAARLYGRHHPEALGRPLPASFPEGWATVAPFYERAFAGEVVRLAAQPVDTRGDGAAEDVFDALLSPVRGTDGEVALVHMTGFEIGERVRAGVAQREAKDRFQALVVAGACSIYRMSPDWRIMDRLDSRTLATTSEPIEDWVDRYVVEADRPEVFAAIARAIRTRSPFELEHRVLLADGRVGWVLSRAVPRLGPGGEIVEWFGAASDVTERRAAADRLRDGDVRHRIDLEDQIRERTFQLRRGHDLLQATMDSSLDMIQVFEAVRGMTGEIVDFRWILNNHAAERWYGDVVGRSLLASNPGVVAEGIFETFQRVVETGEPDQSERHYVHEQFDGWFLQSVVKLHDGVATTTKDISDWRAAQAKLLELREQMAEAKLHESEQRLALVFRTLPVGIAVLDGTGEIVMANDEMLRFLPTGRIPSRDPPSAARWRAWDSLGRLVEPGDFPGARALRGEPVSPGLQMLYRADGGREIWTEVLSTPLRDGEGRVNGAISVVVDVDRLKRSEERARASEERLRQFGEASGDILWIRDADTLQWTYLTRAFERIYGLSCEEALTGDNYRNWQDLILAEDRARAIDNVARVREGEPVSFEYRIRRPLDGQLRWLRNTDFPMRDAAGHVRWIGGISQDVTAPKEAERRLKASEERLRSAAEVAQFALWDWNMNTGEVVWSDEHFRMHGYAVDEVIPSYDAWIARIHPQDRAATEAALEAARDGRHEYVHEFRTLHPDGAIRWLSARGRFFYDGEVPVRMIGAMIDATARREWEEAQKVMVAELQHRTRNLIAVVRGIAEDTMEQTGPTETFRDAFSDRLMALSRVQGLLSRAEVEPITIGAVVRLELEALGAGLSSDRVALSGPDVWLRNSTVQTLALALHELATNARKYGALSHERGHLAVTWSERVEACERRLVLNWAETGLEHAFTKVQPAFESGGYGRELIEQALPHALGARTSYTLGETGVWCTIDLPARQDVQGGRTP